MHANFIAYLKLATCELFILDLILQQKKLLGTYNNAKVIYAPLAMSYQVKILGHWKH